MIDHIDIIFTKKRRIKFVNTICYFKLKINMMDVGRRYYNKHIVYPLVYH